MRLTVWTASYLSVVWKPDSFLEAAGNFELSHDVEIYLIHEACLLPPAAAASHVLLDRKSVV